MAFERIQLRAAQFERRAMRGIAHKAPLPLVRAANSLGLFCDARFLLGLGAIWLVFDYPFDKRRSALRFTSTIGITTLLHHAIKRVVSQQRPDRVIANRSGERTGRPYDAMPSGHAMHAGAIASFASSAVSGSAGAWLAALGMAATRLLILAHWPSGVAAGFMMGISVERATRIVFTETSSRLIKRRRGSVTAVLRFLAPPWLQRRGRRR